MDKNAITDNSVTTRIITRLLVANRGEIARRVFRTCRDLGIETVAVHSDADAEMRFVSDADTAVRLPGNSSSDTYLRGDLIVAAALSVGADAIHPGYGFLSENADFARSVIEAGLIWVGPSPESMEAMASKIEAKKAMTRAGVPVLGDIAEGDATEGDLPVLVKASAGGGGRGMRIVRTLADLAGEIAAARSEAEAAFGDGTVFVEPYVETGRHIEVQVVGAADGVLVLGERDCSVQRRHQKVIEEAPAPGLSDEIRRELHGAARRAAESIGYLGAGTVEFLYDPGRDQFYFLEMNTRLQVEHPVTEAVFGVDLVAMQIGVAEGRGIGELVAGHAVATGHEAAASSGEVTGHVVVAGHAVEVRLYAEDPMFGYRPQAGTLRRFDIPGVAAEFENLTGPGIRLDSGVGEGDTIGTFYDAMIAKVICWAPTREQALRQLAGALRRAELHGLRTNRDLLVSLLGDPVFVGGAMDTTWLDRLDIPERGLGSPDELARKWSAFAATVALAETARAERGVQQRIPAGFRNVRADALVTTFTDDSGEAIEIRWRGGSRFTLDGHDDVEVISVVVGSPPGEGTFAVVLETAGLRHTFRVFTHGDDIDVESALGHVALRHVPRFVDPADQIGEGSLLAPMPGTIVSVDVGVNEEVAEGQTLMVMEAMKMQHRIAAPHSGTVVELAAEVGQQVDAGTVLAVVCQPNNP
ncbi:MAG: biotin carboxylase N-terminal domain-containing protein [Microthrixaceae bacterium]